MPRAFEHHFQLYEGDHNALLIIKELQSFFKILEVFFSNKLLNNYRVFSKFSLIYLITTNMIEISRNLSELLNSFI